MKANHQAQDNACNQVIIEPTEPHPTRGEKLFKISAKALAAIIQ
jgi:hypothetical protein